MSGKEWAPRITGLRPEVMYGRPAGSVVAVCESVTFASDGDPERFFYEAGATGTFGKLLTEWGAMSIPELEHLVTRW